MSFRVGNVPVAFLSPFGLIVDGSISVINDNFELLELNRLNGDGILVDFQRDYGAVGSISVNASVVSYNTFTGSHYAWTDEQLERGELVRLTGDNRCVDESSDSEAIYGIERSSRANDPACLGAYLAPHEAGASAPDERGGTHLVMAVGNGEMWVIDTGRALQPGDLLISSDVAGCAMLDDSQRFPVGHVIARAADRVDWAAVTDARDGVKRARISVLFENFTRS